MTRRGGVWVVGVGLCGGLLSACAHTVHDQLAAEPAVPATTPAVGVRSVPAPPAPVAAAPKEKEEEKPIRPAKYPPDGRPDIDLLPQTPPDMPPPPPPPERQPAEVKPAATALPPAKEPPLVAALRCYMDRRPAEAVALLQGGDPTSQELLLTLLPIAALLGEAGKPSARETGAVLDQLDTLVEPLRAKVALVLDKFCFCREIKMFGVYDALPEDYVFRPGEYVHVYVELRNFTSLKKVLPNGQADYMIDLKSAYEIRDAAGKKVSPGGSGEIRRKGPNVSHTQRRDYFDGYHFCLPELPSGLYTLWIYVTDKPTQRVARRSLDFHVAAVPVRNQ